MYPTNPDASAPTPAVAETPPVALPSVLPSKFPETPIDASALTETPTLPSATTAVSVTSASADAPASALKQFVYVVYFKA